MKEALTWFYCFMYGIVWVCMWPIFLFLEIRECLQNKEDK